ncbi:DNA polymerase alpha/epsilon subunit B-domain-containing protein [Geranomyces variabilis]|nr:DNA polymerase alpha/epsilon subunit B-domain-containing protein [Geranomyces variabilis]KAJ3142985.1 DNA polymerase alpha subunit B [Geranomyces variabilis]
MLSAVDSDSSKEDILAAFGPRLSTHPDVLERLVSYTQIFNVSAEDLHAKWEAYTLTPAVQRSDADLTVPTLAHLDELQTSLLRMQRAAKQEVLGTDSLLNVRDRNPFTEGKMFTNDSLQNLFADGNEDMLSGLRTPAKVKRKVVPKDAASYSAGRYTGNKTPATTATTPKTPVSASRFHNDGISFPSSPMTPIAERLASANATLFADRRNRNKIEEVLNDQVPAGARNAGQSAPCDITLLPGQQTDGYRYMYERLIDRGDYLDDRIEQFAGLISGRAESEASSSKPEEGNTERFVQHPGVPTQGSIFTVGRICCDAVVDKAKLNEQSVTLESSRAIGAGCRVNLDLRELPGYALFPGQLLGLEGTNTNGKVISVSKFIQPPLPPKATSTPSQLCSYYPEDNPASGLPVNVLIANGPYTLNDSLGYEPFEDLVAHIEAETPDVVILQGPFVDASHPMIEEGNVDMELDDLFRTCISSRVARILRAKKDAGPVKVIMIPSTRDACSEWVSFPQPSLAAGLNEREALERRRQLGIPGEVMLFPNPVQFTINEIVFACCSTDILLQMSAEELARVPKTGTEAATDVVPPHKISRLFRHVMSQRSFYPLFPPALNDACLDLSRSAALELQATPDVLIVGSRMQYMARKLEGCICVNPGLLVMGRAGGTFAKMSIWPLDLARIREMAKGRGDNAMDADDDDDDEEAIGNAVDERCRVVIQRI